MINLPTVQRLMRVPLIYKILVGNMLIVALGAVVGTVITVWHVRQYPEDPHYGLIVIFAAMGFVISFVVNNWILKMALQPLDCLQAAVNAIRRGEPGVQIRCGGPTDERLDRLVETFNLMVSQQAADAHRLQNLSHRILQAQEEERQRVARELHDEAAQALTSLLVHLRLLERAYTPEQAQQRVHELRELTAGALEEVRRVALDLRPKILDDLGLTAALAWRVDEFNAAAEATATLHVEGINERLPRMVELVFYRVAQEALNNAARHAAAAHVTLTLRRIDETLHLSIVDDGKGFDVARKLDSQTHDGLGLLGICERMSMIGGGAKIDAERGRGTRITVHAPITVTPIATAKESTGAEVRLLSLSPIG
jgi:two-component system, NarL family, sensor histidine kinase UhpB